MKIFIASMVHESCYFSPIPTNMDSFQHGGLLFRPPQKQNAQEAFSTPGYGDFLRLAHERGDEVIPGLLAWAEPSGIIDRHIYEELRDELLGTLKEALPIDAVFLMLHGAQAAYGYDDCEGDLLEKIREIVGPDVSIGVELDLHTNLTDRMVQNSTFLVACHEYPHIDFRERAELLYSLVADTVSGKSNPTSCYQIVPVLGVFPTTQGEMQKFVSSIKSLEREFDVLAISLLHGFLWSDTPHTSASVVVTTDNNPKKAMDLCRQLSERFFQIKDQPSIDFLPVKETIDQAIEIETGPIVIADIADNPGGGAAGDSTFILEELLKRNISNATVGLLYDPEVVEEARGLGAGEKISIQLGGKFGKTSGRTLSLEATIIKFSSGVEQHPFEDPVGKSIGDAVALDLGGISIVVNNLRQQTFSMECFTEMGICLTDKRLVVVKSSTHFLASFGKIATAVFYCSTPSTMDINLSKLPYRNLKRPIWPLDNITTIPVQIHKS